MFNHTVGHPLTTCLPLESNPPARGHQSYVRVVNHTDDRPGPLGWETWGLSVARLPRAVAHPPSLQDAPPRRKCRCDLPAVS